jgi:hypothetical protein
MTRRSVSAVLAAALLTTAAGCEEELPRSIRLIVGLHVAVAQVDQIAVRLIAGKDLGTGLTCEPEPALSFDVHGAQDVPVILDVFPGADYDVWVGYEVRWLRGGAEVSHATGRRPWPSSGAAEIDVTLEPDCLTAVCAEHENCVAGDCITTGASPFDPTLREPDAQDCILRGEAP